MSFLILGDNRAPLPIDVVDLGSYRLTRVAASDPAVRDSLDPTWQLTDILLLHPVREPLPWERRVANELAKELAADVGTTREVSEACPPTPVAPANGAPSQSRGLAGTVSADDLAAWLQDSCDSNGFVTPRALSPKMPNDATRVALTATSVSPSAIGELSADIRHRRDAALAEEYLAVLLEVGTLRIEWLRGDAPCASAEFLAPGSMRAQLEEFDSVDAVIPFYRNENGSRFAFDPTADPPTIVLLDGNGDVTDAFDVSFVEWLARWKSCVGAGLHSAFESAPLPPRSASAIQRQWRTIEAWVRPMYEDWEQQH